MPDDEDAKAASPDDEDAKAASTDKILYKTVTSIRAIPETQVIFADGVANHIMGPGISKFHLYRNDAVLGQIDVYERLEVLQLIMPTLSFVDMVAFFEHRLRVMVKNGNVTQEVIAERREFYAHYKV